MVIKVYIKYLKVSYTNVHFHQKRTIRRYLTNKPKLEASKVQKAIASKLKYSNEVRFKKWLDIWYLKYKNFIDESTINNETGKYFIRNQKIRSAYSTTNLLKDKYFSL